MLRAGFSGLAPIRRALSESSEGVVLLRERGVDLWGGLVASGEVRGTTGEASLGKT